MTVGSAGGSPTRRLSNAPNNWVEWLRARQPEGSWRRRLYDRLVVPVGDPSEFTGDEESLAQELTPNTGDPGRDNERATELLAEAQAIYERAEERAAGAQTRATTLQGAVAIAASLLLAGAALVLDQTELQGAGWRAAFAAMLFAVTASLVMCGVRALSATSTIHAWHRPTAGEIVNRAKLDAPQAKAKLAAETLVDYSYNTKIAAWKVAYLGAAAWWFRVALACLLGLALLVGVYAVAGNSNEATKTTSAITTPRLFPRAGMHPFRPRQFGPRQH